MAGSTPTLTLMALLCLGLCRGSEDQIQNGTLPKPSIWAEPGPVVPVGSPVTIWCQGSPQAEVYQLYREGGSAPVLTEAPQSSSNKASFFIYFITPRQEGRYLCAYSSSREWSGWSDPLNLVVTRFYSAPSLSAQPSPVVASGGRVIFICSSREPADTFYLLKEGDADPPQKREPRFPQGTQQAFFLVGPVSPSHAGTYRCYQNSSFYPHRLTYPGDPLRLQVTGVYGEPSLSARPGPLVPSGHSLTLRCTSEAGFDVFALTKDEGFTGPPQLEEQHSPEFFLGPMTSTHRGQYRCYGGHSLSQAWSAPSAPLDILITGKDWSPTLSAQPGPSVSPGEKVTLRCRSEGWADTFFLSKEGSPAPPQLLRVQDPAAPPQADFTFSAVTSDQGGTYRCYSSRSTDPHLLSAPSEPLELRVSGLPAQDYTMGNAIRLALGSSLLLVLGLLLWEAWHSHRRTLDTNGGEHRGAGTL